MAEIPQTQKKLREAHFFLACMQERVRDIPDPEEFEFFLSAFLSAARSVTFVLKKEEKEKYNSWFPLWLNGLSQGDQRFLKQMRDQRNTTQKEGRADISIDWEPIPLVEYLSRTHDHYRVSWAAPVEAQPSHVKLPVPTFILDGSKVELIGICMRYMALLDRIVTEFMAAHST